MIYLAHTAHWQFLALLVGTVAWILVLTATGLNEWRLWHLADVSVVTSGVAWVGIWRACFYSHALPGVETCRSIAASDTFVPAEIAAAQVLMVLALVSGLAGNVAAVMAMRMVYFSVEDRRNMRLVFLSAGVLYVLTAALCSVPLAWNMNSVLSNTTIDFPPQFQLPAAPLRQKVGSAIGVGIVASVLMLLSGMVFLCYRYAWVVLSTEDPKETKEIRDLVHGPWSETTLTNIDHQGRDNPAFNNEEKN